MTPDPTARISKAGPVEALSALLQDVDPLYRPAEFLLGFTYLSRGDGKNAAAVFSSLVGRFEDEFDRLVDLLGDKWLETPRWMGIGKRIPFVREWVQKYADAWTDLHGGRYVRGAEAWQELKAALDDRSSAKWSHKFEEALIDIRIDTTRKLLHGSKLPAIAAGRESSAEWSPERARERLDHVLDKHEVWNFDLELDRLSMDSLHERLMARFRFLEPGDGPFANPASEMLKRLEELKGNPIAMLLESELNNLKPLIERNEWEQVRELIRNLRRYTGDRTPHGFRKVLDNPEVETWKGWVASLFLPAFVHVRRQRRELRQPLYVESVYYLAYSLMMCVEPDSLLLAQETVGELRRARLAPNLSGRGQDLNVLTACLGVEAGVRLAVMKPDLSSFELDRLIDVSKNQIEHACRDARRGREVQAAAWVALGMIKRRMRFKQTKRDREEHGWVDEKKQKRARFEEMEHYRRALDLKSSANTHCYLV